MELVLYFYEFYLFHGVDETSCGCEFYMVFCLNFDDNGLMELALELLWYFITFNK